jgi:hypothetical protein
VNALSQFLTRRRGAAKHGSDEQFPAAIATLPADHPVNMPLPAPVLTAGVRDIANAMHPQAQPFTAPAGHAARGAHARTTPRHAPPDGGTLLRVRDRLRDLPAPPLSREQQFAADMRSPRKGGLPIFRSLASPSRLGWCGLNEEYLVAPLVMHGTEVWERHARDVIDARFAEAQAELRGTVAEQDRHETRVRDAADAALALGYPGEAL